MTVTLPGWFGKQKSGCFYVRHLQLDGVASTNDALHLFDRSGTAFKMQLKRLELGP